MPVLHAAGRRFGWHGLPLRDVADRTWTLSPATRARYPKAHFLSNQLERVTGTMFSDGDARKEVHGGIVDHPATKAFLFRNAWLLDGVLYKGRGFERLRSRTKPIPSLRAEREIERGAVYSTFAGITYFGNWLLHDCIAYPLAAEEGDPVTVTRATVGCHEPTYEEWLGMRPSRVDAAFFRELVLFDDFGYTDDKRARFRALRAKLFSRVHVEPHPGVFVLRGRTGHGKPRVLENEAALAGLLARRRGFRVLDPEKSDVATIVKTCAGARVVVGVEGSGLAHGILGLAPGGSLLVLQPPDRFVMVFKTAVEREDQHFAFVVGQPRASGFYVDPDEVERTLDLLPPARV